MSGQFQIVITGVSPNSSLQQAAKALTIMTKAPEDKTTKLIQNAPSKFGKPLSLNKAQVYKDYLNKAGLEVQITEVQVSVATQNSPRPVVQPQAATQAAMATPAGLSLVPTGNEVTAQDVEQALVCPSCSKARNEDQLECASCGIVFAKYEALASNPTSLNSEAIESDVEEEVLDLDPEDVVKMLKNTYMLLSATLLFSALTCVAGMFLGIDLGTLVFLIGAIVLLGVTHLTKNSIFGLVSVFAFTGWMGLGIGPVIDAYLSLSNGAELIATAALGTATIFLGLSGYVLTTKKDFSFMGGMLFSGLIVVVVGSIAAYFFSLSSLSLAISCISILVFSGYILYDTSQIIHRGETNYIIATVELYLDILNLFLSLLRILGYFSGEE